jgi:hypothetical protein
MIQVQMNDPCFIFSFKNSLREIDLFVLEDIDQGMF